MVATGIRGKIFPGPANCPRKRLPQRGLLGTFSQRKHGQGARVFAARGRWESVVVMKITMLLNVLSLGIGGTLALVSLADLAVGVPFGRFSWLTDLFLLSASGLLIWQVIETWFGK